MRSICVQRVFRTVDRQRPPLHFAEAAQIVEAHDVIGVGMGEDHRIEAVELFAQRLLAQVGRGVDQDFGRGRFEMERGAGPLVARIGREADRAAAADHRHALRRARAEHGHDQLFRFDRGHFPNFGPAPWRLHVKSAQSAWGNWFEMKRDPCRFFGQPLG